MTTEQAKQEYDKLTIKMIAIRAYRDWGLNKNDIIMELNTVKTPIDLDRLLHSESDTFTHDIGGINKHLNRETGELKGFHPICAKQQ